MKNFLARAMEEELGVLFFNFQRVAALIISLEEMVHQQPPTPLFTDSATSDGFLNFNIRQIKSRAIDMILYWVHDRARQ